MSAKKSAVATLKTTAPADLDIGVTIINAPKPVYVARAIATPVLRGQAVYLYGATPQAQGVPTTAGITAGPAYATYAPRAAQAACWAWFIAGNSAGPISAIKANAKLAGHGGQIAAMLRHAARMGAITITA